MVFIPTILQENMEKRKLYAKNNRYLFTAFLRPNLKPASS
ncbi:conserved hypothetical protein [Streptococcus equi subsp. zooepidemicus ATCC 35246]|nr:conserved hypothetical protein [Streptococcus equi subsp. zooepidemicus ATCC 35246]